MLMYGGEGVDIAEQLQRLGRHRVRADLPALAALRRRRAHAGWRARDAGGAGARGRVEARSGAHWLSSASRPARNLGRAVVAGADGRRSARRATRSSALSSRPDYLALVYGAGRATPGESLKDFPPTFLLSRRSAITGRRSDRAAVHGPDDEAGAVAEIHVYQQGRHGFGSGFGSPEFCGWMPLLSISSAQAASCRASARKHASASPVAPRHSRLCSSS